MSPDRDDRPRRPAGRRQTDVLRNLDTPLKVVGLITVKSCGVVLLYFSFTCVLNMVGFWDLVFGKWGSLVHLASVAVLALVLAHIERQEDEHLVVAAIRYFVNERVLERWWYRRTFVYSGLALHRRRPHPLERIFQ